MGGISAQIKNYKNLQKKIDDMKKAPNTVIKRTMSDVRKRVPGWIAQEVSQTYGIKKSEINGGEIGTVTVVGNNPQEAKIIYRGRVLTPTHFGMTPKAPGKNAYTLKASILKGEKKTLGKVKKFTKKQRANIGKNFTRQGTQSSNKSPIMLMHTGNTKEGGTNYVPFQRVSQKRNDIKAIKTISLPQMVSGKRASDRISTVFTEKLSDRIDQHMKLLEK